MRKGVLLSLNHFTSILPDFFIFFPTCTNLVDSDGKVLYVES